MNVGGSGHHSSSSRSLVTSLLLVLGVVALALLFWTLRGVLILAFGAIVLAVVLRALTAPLKNRLGLPDKVALFLAVLLVGGTLAVALWLFGREVAEQAQTLQQAIPAAWQAMLAWVDNLGVSDPIKDWLRSGAARGTSGVVGTLREVLFSLSSALTDTVLVLAGGIYLAADPGLYRKGLSKLAPRRQRLKIEEALDDCWRALRLWLIGRFVTMVIVGIVTGVGLWILGMPAALTLGIAAGVLEFIPFLGPIAAAVPAVLLALAIDPATLPWVLGLYLLIQQIEGNIVTPLVQQRAVSLPPALLLFALVCFGLLFGVIGILLAEPLTVVIYVLVKRLYVRDYLHTPTAIPGEESSEDDQGPPGH